MRVFKQVDDLWVCSADMIGGIEQNTVQHKMCGGINGSGKLIEGVRRSVIGQFKVAGECSPIAFKLNRCMGGISFAIHRGDA